MKIKELTFEPWSDDTSSLAINVGKKYIGAILYDGKGKYAVDCRLLGIDAKRVNSMKVAQKLCKDKYKKFIKEFVTGVK